MTRAFVAVSPPAHVLDAVATYVERLGASAARVTTRAQWHVTVQFLGNRADIDAVAGALAGLDAAGGEVRLGGAGAFPNAKRARVLWLGFTSGGDMLTHLASAVGARLAPLGYEVPPRDFHPHLTLARARTPTDLRSHVAALGDTPVGTRWRVDELLVYESELRRDGARYIPRASITLRS